jgi:hypothetical protein
MAAQIIARCAATVINLNSELDDIDKMITDRFRTHPHAEIITSMTGIGDLLGAEFLAATGGTLAAFASAVHLAGYAGLAPTPRDSGRCTGNLHRPRRYSRQLHRAFYSSALISIQHSAASKTYYERKRAEGKRHGQAVVALARRRVNVLWACSATGASTRNGQRSARSRLDKRIENQLPSTPVGPVQLHVAPKSAWQRCFSSNPKLTIEDPPSMRAVRRSLAQPNAWLYTLVCSNWGWPVPLRGRRRSLASHRIHSHLAPGIGH